METCSQVWWRCIACISQIPRKRKIKLPEPKIIVENVYPHQMVSEITMAAALGGLLGAKIFHLLEYWTIYC